MTEQNLININRVFAYFMGFEIIDYKGKQIYNGNKNAKTIGELKTLWGGLYLEHTGRWVKDVKYPFNTDFNYLIPVIRRIEEQGYVVAIVGISYKVYKLLDEQNPIVSLVCGDLSKKTEMTCDLLVNFIENHLN
jgi:hypothetical protein